MQVFLNGKFVTQSRAKVSVLDPGLQHGEGLFETLLVKNSELKLLREHLVRLKQGAKVLGIKLPQITKIKQTAERLVQRNKLIKGMLRITATPESFFITTRKFPPRSATARACFVPMERCLPQIKSLNYLPSVLAQRIALANGFDEALLVDRDGYVTEGGRTNLFWVKNKKVFTPDLGSALPGITRGKVIEIVKKFRFKLVEKKVHMAELRKADEIFLTNAPMEIWTVAQLEKRQLKVGEITQQIKAAYLKKYV